MADTISTMFRYAMESRVVYEETTWTITSRWYRESARGIQMLYGLTHACGTTEVADEAHLQAAMPPATAERTADV
jgi:hypothetical protein